MPQRTAPREQLSVDSDLVPTSLDFERLHFDRRQTCLASIAIPSELIDCCLQRPKRQGRAANPALDDFFTHLIVDLGKTQLFDFIERETLCQLGDDRAAGLADRATVSFKRHGLDAAIIADLEIHGNEVTATRVAAAEVNAGILHAPLIPRILVMIDDVLDVRLTVQRDPFLLARWSYDARAFAEYTSPSRSERLNQAVRSSLPEWTRLQRWQRLREAGTTRAGERQTEQPDLIVWDSHYPTEPGTADPFRNARTRVFAAAIQSGVVTSNQINRALRRSQVS